MSLTDNVSRVVILLNQEYGVSISFIAKECGLSRQYLNNTIHKKVKMSDDTALKISRYIVSKYGRLLETKKTESPNQ